MKDFLKRLGRTLRVILFLLLILLTGTTIYHHVMLRVEASKIVPNGKLVQVNGHRLHLYAEGVKAGKPTLVFMSGSGTVAPVYDFKPLYSRLSEQYRVVVVEKAGYGYSDIKKVPRDLEIMLSETRQALSFAGEVGPYVLMPHSMSGIEAIYWAQTQPEEVQAIIGLDMAVPETYEHLDFRAANTQVKIGQATVWLGLVRIPGLYPLNTTALSEQEIQQHKYLMHRNALNLDYLIEGQAAQQNARTVAQGKLPNIPTLLFVSNGQHSGDNWIPSEERFAKAVNGQIVYLDCDHYVHYYEPELIAKKTVEFLRGLE